MNATNRVANRVLLFLAGVLLLVAGAGALAAGMLSGGEAPTWLRQPAAAIADAWTAAAGQTVEIAGVGTVSALLLSAAAAVLILLLLLLLFLGSRRSGRTRTVLEVDGETGRTTVDRDVVDAVLTAPLMRRPDVLSVRTAAYRLGRIRGVELAVTVRPGAPLGAVVATAEAAVREGDALLGERLPVLLHLSDRRWRDAFRPPTRVW